MAVPTFQAAGTVVESASNNVIVAWPAHQADDIGLLIVEHGDLARNAFPRLVTDAGFRPIPWGHAQSGNGTSAGRTCMSIFWCRATSGAMPSPVVRFVDDHVQAVIITLRGCSAVGNPWNIGAWTIQDTDTTAISLNGFTTTENDCLVVGVVASAGSGRSVSGWTNASLGSVTERVDVSSTIGDKDGSQIAVVTGTKAIAGAVSATTATNSSSKRHVGCQIAFTGVTQSEDKTPYIQNVGLRVQSDIANITVPWPAHVQGDLALLIVESNTHPIVLYNDEGFIALHQQAAHISGDNAATAIGVWYKIATGSSESSPVVEFRGSHLTGLILTIRGVASSDPFGPVEGSNTGSTSSTFTGPTDSTTNPSTLQLVLVSHGNDNEAQQNYVHSISNASLKDLDIFAQAASAIGPGSGICIIHGKKLTAGAYNATTGSTLGTQHNTVTVINVNAILQDTLIGDPATIAVTGQQASFRIDTPATHASFEVTPQEATLANTVEAFLGEPAVVTVTGQDAVLDSIGTGGGGGSPEDPLPPTFWKEEVLPPPADWNQEL